MRISGLSLSLAIMASALPAIGQTPNPEAENYREIILEIPEKATIRQTIVKTSERTQNGVTTGATVSSEYLNTVVMTDDGYSVSKALIKADMAPLAGADTQSAQYVAAQKMLEDMSKISNIDYTANESLGPIKIDNWPQIQTALKTMLTSAAGDGGEMAFNQIYGKMTPEGAAQLFLQGDSMLATPHNLALNIGETVSADSEFPAPIGGAMFQAREQITLDGYDEASDSAKVSYVYEPTADSVTAFVKMITLQMMESSGVNKTANPDEVEQFKKMLTVEISTRCMYDISVKTGLVKDGNCVTVRDVRIGEQGSRQKESWQLSETLVP